MIKMVLIVLIFFGQLGASDNMDYVLTKRSNASYLAFKNTLELYAKSEGRKMGQAIKSNDMNFHHAIFYMIKEDKEKALHFYQLIETEYAKRLPLQLKLYMMDIQFYLQRYLDTTKICNRQNCLQADNLYMRHRCRYYLGLSRFFIEQSVNKDIQYAAYYFPQAKQLIEGSEDAKR